MELRHLRYFVAVAEELHFGRAAERLHIVQPALSKQIIALEGELGVRLFHRTKRKVELTEAGKAFYDETRGILGQTERAAAAARSAARGLTGRLGIGFIGPATYSILPQTLRVFRERFPEVELGLHEWTSVRQIGRLTTSTAQECEIQVGFVRPPVSVAGDSLVLEPVLKEGVIAAVPEGHSLAVGGDLPVSALAEEPFVMIARHREPGLYDHYIGLCRRAGFSPRVVQEANRIHTIVGLVASGMGVAFAPSSIEQLRRPGVVYRKLAGPIPDLEMAAVWHKENDDLPVLRNFLDVVRETSANLPRGRPVVSASQRVRFSTAAFAAP